MVFVNASLHIGGAIRFRRYVPGLLSAVLLYPLGSSAFYMALTTGRLPLSAAITALAWGALWHTSVPLFHVTYQRIADSRRGR